MTKKETASDNKKQNTSTVASESEVQKPTDADMPQPETADYTPTYKLTPLFMKMFDNTISDMPYSKILKNQNDERIKLIDIVKFVELKKNSITIDELNIIIGFLAGAEFKFVRELMEIVEQPNKQHLLWTTTA